MGTAFVIALLSVAMNVMGAISGQSMPPTAPPAFIKGASVYLVSMVEQQYQGCIKQQALEVCDQERIRTQIGEYQLQVNLLQHLKQVGYNSVSVVIPLNTDGYYTTRVFADPAYTPTLPQIRFFINAARRMGFDVVIKPLIDEQKIKEDRGNGWRGNIQPANIDSLFANYIQLVGEYADIAKQTGASQLVIGTELSSLETSRYDGYWKSLITVVRQKLNGTATKIAYAENWDKVDNLPSWIGLVDIIGIDGYFPAYGVNEGSSVSQIQQALEANAPAIERVKRLGKPVEIAEVGMASVPGKFVHPYDTGDDADPVDLVGQQKYLAAACEFYASHSQGLYLWFYGIWPLDHPDQDRSMVLWGKPAEQEITACFSRH